jgi:hypothetical protein
LLYTGRQTAVDPTAKLSASNIISVLPTPTAEREDYSVDLEGVTNLELTIIPEIADGPARATLAQLCLA